MTSAADMTRAIATQPKTITRRAVAAETLRVFFDEQTGNLGIAGFFAAFITMGATIGAITAHPSVAVLMGLVGAFGGAGAACLTMALLMVVNDAYVTAKRNLKKEADDASPR